MALYNTEKLYDIDLEPEKYSGISFLEVLWYIFKRVSEYRITYALDEDTKH